MKKFVRYCMRHFRNAKLQWSVALASLILGWSCFIAIGMFLYGEMTYDQFHKKYNRIYRVVYDEKTAEIPGQRDLGTTGPTVGPALKDAFPEVEAFARFRYSPDWLVQYNNARFYERSVWYADSSVFSIFDFPLMEGNASTALTLAKSVVITHGIAKKYFGNDEAMGKTLIMDNEAYTVTGVLAEIPSNSHIRFDFLLPFHAFRVPYGYPVTLQDWGWIAFHNYILLKPHTDPKVMEGQLVKLVRQHFTPNGARKFRFELQPLKDIYFGDAKDENIAEGNKTYLLVLGLSALMIILSAAFNFANLFTAMSIIRAKELGIRKMLGAGRKSVAWNINTSAIVPVLCTLIISLSLLPLWTKLAPWSADSFHFSAREWMTGFGLLLAIACIIGFAAGLYPSLLLAGYNFQNLLKGAFKVGKKGLYLRRSMLTGQFAISIFLCCSVAIISKQMAYLRKVDTGYAKDELLLIHMPGEELARKFEFLRNKFSQNPDVADVSIAGGRFDGSNGSVPIFTETTSPLGEPMSIFSVAMDFFKTAGIPVLRGKEFTNEEAYDTLSGVILNESAVNALGWKPETAIGKRIRIGDILLHGEVMGVVKNFNFVSLHNSIAPLVMYYPRSRIEDIYVRVKGRDLSRIVSSLSRDWKLVVPSLPFDFTFMNDNLARQYHTDQVFEKMFRFFSVIAILIACLGFYGLLNQDIIYRLKEIAVRKVLGADSPGISFLLLRQYLFLFAIANAIAWPLSYYYMNEWLREFPYRQSIQWFIFPLAGFAFLVLSVLSVIWKVSGAAKTNPVKSLRS